MDIAFCAKLSADERLFVLAHETWHCVLLHMLRCQTRDPRAFNVATDMEVNRMLAKEGLKTPDWCLMPKREWEGLSAEEIYERVRKRPETPPEAQEGKDGHGGTDFRPPFDYAAEHPELEPSCLIYITDGCGPAPDRPPPYPVLWVLTADGEKPAPWGMELRLKPGGGEYIN